MNANLTDEKMCEKSDRYTRSVNIVRQYGAMVSVSFGKQPGMSVVVLVNILMSFNLCLSCLLYNVAEQ